MARHLARTDLKWLCRNVLDYDLMKDEVHDPVYSHLTQFSGVQGIDQYAGMGYKYVPKHPDPEKVLPEWPRRRLLLDPRGWFKTTNNVIAHSIQILLNFPDASILLVHAQQDIINKKLGELCKKFTQNDKMQTLFPEYCNFKQGRQDELWLPNSKNDNAPNVSTTSIQSTTAGMHYHWIKFTDIVDKENSRSEYQLAKIRQDYHQYLNLLISPKYFVDLEGTCYDYADIYNWIIDRELQRQRDGKKPVYQMFVRGCFEKQPPPGQKERFHPEERDWPYLLDANGKRISRFPEQAPLEHLETLEDEDPYTFSRQQLNHPVSGLGDDAPFPLEKMSWIRPEELKYVNMLWYEMTIDTAETIELQSDFTAGTVAGIDRFGRRYIVDGFQTKCYPEDIQKYLLDLYFRWNCNKLKIEQSSFNRGLYPGIRRYLDLAGKWINFDWLQRDQGESKKQRILSMQPAFKSGALRFSTALNPYVKEQLVQQLTRFPTGHDDLLDSLADHFQNETNMGALRPKPSAGDVQRRALELAFSGIKDESIEDHWDQYHSRLGGL